jgi:hypothetical protein
MCSRACLDYFGGGGYNILLLLRHNADFSSSSSVPSYTRITTELSGPLVFPYLQKCKVRFRYFDIYLTAVGLTPGGSSILHIQTQTIHRTTP